MIDKLETLLLSLNAEDSFMIHADQILKTMEDFGMSPPGYPSPNIEAEGEFIYEWEPEHE